MHRIQKVSTYLLIVFNVLLIALPLITLLIWVLIDTEPMKHWIEQGIFLKPIETPLGLKNAAQIPWTITTQAIALGANMLEILPLLFSLFSLKTIFKNYQKGQIFSAENARQYRRLGLYFFLNALLTKPVSDMLMVLSVTLSNPPGQRYITFGFGTPNIEALFCGMIVMVISWVMLEASHLQEEQKLTV